MDTFEIEGESPAHIEINWKWDVGDQFVDVAILGLLQHDRYTRETCPFIYATILVGLESLDGGGRGVTFNGRVNTGGGILLIPEKALDTPLSLDSTLEHEIGHTFGLIHPDLYTADSNRYVMSQKRDPRAEGILTSEDLLLLAHAQRVFPTFYELNEKLRERTDVMERLAGALQRPRKLATV
jgi:hypothetical protein